MKPTPPSYNYWMGGLQYYLFRLVDVTEDPELKARYQKALDMCDKAKETYELMLAELKQQNIAGDEVDILKMLEEKGRRRAEANAAAADKDDTV